jgi:hypothetical protein
LDIKSEPNRGTLIEVRLPLARSQETASGSF